MGPGGRGPVRGDRSRGSSQRLLRVALAASLLAALLGVGLAPRSAAAQVASDPLDENLLEDEFGPLELFRAISRLRPRFRLIQDFVVDQEYRGAEVDSFATAFRASLVAPLGRSLAIRIVGRLQIEQFDFRGDSAFLDTGRAPADPFDELFDHAFRIEGRYRVADDWALLAAAQLRSGWESGADYVSGLQGAGFLGFAHIFRERFSIVLGARVSSRMARSGARVWPAVQLGWQVTDRLEIATRNLGLRASYRFSKELGAYLEGEWRQRSYRLEDREGEIGKGVLQNRSLPVILGVRWRVARDWRLRAHVGANAYQRWRVRDEDREEIDRATSRGPAFLARLDVEFRF